MIKLLKRTDRILLEMHTGMLLFGLICQIAGFFLAGNQVRYAQSLWFGILFAAVNCVHMARTLDRALSAGEAAAKTIARGYVFRYLMLIVILGVVSLTGILDTLIVFLGYMSMKVTAYLQPLTHKFFNKLFGETDPVPQALPEEECPQEVSEN
ncbi:MAG: ATP synthase subunit I [Roseburia sp.]|nr:ATP synthase subunit I [Roseburia sp.]MCM1099190.1 ATP synthase subunit I [Ruminococcus flavefaciens]